MIVQESNITRERLLSFDRAIRSEPSFKEEQCEGLLKDLEAYLVTLTASSKPLQT
jgi:alpha-glucan,water dikinase